MYSQPNPPEILGSILSDNDLIMEYTPKEKRKSAKSVTATNKMKRSETKSMDIRKMFLAQTIVNNAQTQKNEEKKQEENNVIVLD